MEDPRIEDEVKRARILKQYQDYQNYLDEVDNLDTSSSTGDMQGKKVRIIPTKDSPIIDLFNKSIDKNI